MKRILLASLAGGAIVFIWSAIAHTATPLGTAGLSVVADEAPLADAIRTTVPRPGMYVVPGVENPRALTSEQQQAWMDRIKRGPVALIIVSSLSNGDAITPGRLVSELVTNIIAAFIAAMLAAMLVGTFVRRVVAIVLMAIFASVSLTFSYWIWDAFAAAFVLGELVTETIGWLLAGLAIARLVPAPSAERR